MVQEGVGSGGTVIKHLQWARSSARYFTYIISVNPQTCVVGVTAPIL